jgi:hypothetical protein
MLFSVLQVAEYQGSLGVIQDGNANITALFSPKGITMIP